MRDEVLHLTKGNIPPLSRYFSDKEGFVPACMHGMPLDSVCIVCETQNRHAGDVPPNAHTALLKQVGGDHYTKCPIQPMEYSMANKLDACQHTIIKYVTRFRDKNGIEDLEKAKHVIDMLIAFEEKKMEVGDE